ncbi:MAG TPA: four helix bundle protein [Bacteroidales bacterium]|nr:four helix bundle protein [Bacteroidales bacterium]HRZ76942.1 four helix bundle protein [Bacteroidales bacterium]
MKEKGSILRERLLQFAIDAAKFVMDLPKDEFHQNLAHQLIRSSSSAFLNYGEADSSASAKDFINKLRICIKEVNESLHNLLLLERYEYPNPRGKNTILQAEANELGKMLYASIRTASKRH